MTTDGDRAHRRAQRRLARETEIVELLEQLRASRGESDDPAWRAFSGRIIRLLSALPDDERRHLSELERLEMHRRERTLREQISELRAELERAEANAR